MFSQAVRLGLPVLSRGRGLTLLHWAANQLTLGAGSKKWRFSVRIKKQRVYQVLCYHRVHDSADGIFDPVHPRIFEMHMAHLARYYRVLPLQELVRRSRDGSLPSNAVGVSFDDGYADNYTHALPILETYGIPATIFLTTGSIGTDRPLWHDRVFAALALTRVQAVEFDGRLLSLETLAQRQAAAAHITRTLKGMQVKARDQAILDIQEQTGIADSAAFKRSPILTWAQVQDMTRRNISFGAHTVNHPCLARLDPDVQHREIVHSIEEVESHLQEKVSLFAYPNGRLEDVNGHTLKIVADNGVEAAFTTVFGNNDGAENPLLLKRMPGWGEDESQFGLKLIWYRMAACSQFEKM
ncbi:MAG: polysaccharide deacetylase family protein [Desulfohalobiaceae bacterium]|nr:polysaccharide deacetylase family protein [Desulfohalobiaceae bacterium]